MAAYHSRLQAKLDDLRKIVPATKAGQKLLHAIKRFRQNLFVFVTHRATLYANVRSVLETAR